MIGLLCWFLQKQSLRKGFKLYLILDVPCAKYEVWEGTSLVTWLSHGKVVSPEKKAAMSHQQLTFPAAGDMCACH